MHWTEQTFARAVGVTIRLRSSCGQKRQFLNLSPSLFFMLTLLNLYKEEDITNTVVGKIQLYPATKNLEAYRMITHDIHDRLGMHTQTIDIS